MLMLNYENKEWLYDQYWNKEKSIVKIAKESNTSRQTITRRIKKFNIPIRPSKEATKIAMNKPEMKKRMSMINKGKKFSEETKRKLSEKQIKRYKDPKERLKTSKAMKKVMGNSKIRERISITLKGRYKNDKSWNWKGDNATYSSIHKHMRKYKAKPLICEICGEIGDLELSNKTGKLNRDINNFQYVHHKCHFKYDKENKIIHEGLKRKEAKKECPSGM